MDYMAAVREGSSLQIHAMYPPKLGVPETETTLARDYQFTLPRRSLWLRRHFFVRDMVE